MKKKENEIGITLIALVITIIVLLILAGVALATLTGDSSIIGNAEQVVGEYNNKVKEEQEILNGIEQYLQKHMGTQERGIDSTEIASNPSEYYGGVVSNYTTPGGDPNVQWKIFYADSSNMYLIADDYTHGDYAPNGRGGSAIRRNDTDYSLSFDEVINDYNGSADILNTGITDSRVTKWISYVSDNTESTNENIKAVAYMLDTNIWSVYKNNTYAEYAIGGPTLDMFVASYNQAHPDLNIGYSHNIIGYYVGTGGESSDHYSIGGLDTEDSTYVISDTSKAVAMWLASPSAGIDHYGYLMSVDSRGAVYYDGYYSSCVGFRPLVCLKSDVQLEKQQDGTYIIK